MKRLMIVIALVLAGCATPQVGPVVKQAVSTACDAPVPEKPVYPADQLTGNEDIFTLVKVLWADRKARIAYELKLEPLKGCTAEHH